jgi:HD-like signal output (HDOD) protein
MTTGEIMELSDDLRQRLEALTGLPSLPNAALQVLELSRDPEASLPALARVIKTDPALAARVLRAANSAQFSRGRQCENLRQALVTLGMDTTLTITLSFSVVNALRNVDKGAMDYPGFWKRSLVSALAAQALAEFVDGVDRDNLFLAGLLQDIGMLAVNQLEPGLYTRDGSDGIGHHELDELERSACGATHADIGAWLLRQWGMPDYLPAVVAASHRLERECHQGKWAATSSCVALSGCLADIWSASDCEVALPRLSDLVSDLVGVGPTDVGLLLIRIRERVPETESLFSVPLLEAARMEAVLDEATAMVMRNDLVALKEAGSMVDAAVETAMHHADRAAHVSSPEGLLALAREALDARCKTPRSDRG